MAATLRVSVVLEHKKKKIDDVIDLISVEDVYITNCLCWVGMVMQPL